MYVVHTFNPNTRGLKQQGCCKSEANVIYTARLSSNKTKLMSDLSIFLPWATALFSSHDPRDEQAA